MYTDVKTLRFRYRRKSVDNPSSEPDPTSEPKEESKPTTEDKPKETEKPKEKPKPIKIPKKDKPLPKQNEQPIPVQTPVKPPVVKPSKLAQNKKPESTPIQSNQQTGKQETSYQFPDKEEHIALAQEALVNSRRATGSFNSGITKLAQRAFNLVKEGYYQEAAKEHSEAMNKLLQIAESYRKPPAGVGMIPEIADAYDKAAESHAQAIQKLINQGLAKPTNEPEPEVDWRPTETVPEDYYSL